MDNDLQQQLKTITAENKKLKAERDRAIKQAEQAKSNMSHNNVAMAWINDHKASGEYLAYSPLGWLMYSDGDGVWQAPDVGKIRRALKDTFLINGKHSVTTRDINSAIGLAADHNSRRGATDWDNNPNILICKNNTLDLDTMQALPHSHELYATTKLNADYSKDALGSEAGEQWLNMVNSFFGNNEYFIQEFIGYSLTTDTALDISIWLQSPGGGGKSTFLRAIASMMGGRCGMLNLALLNRKGEESLGVVVGKTLLLAEEVNSRDKLERADLLKLIIDGGMVSVKQMRKDPVTVKSNCKVLWSMNKLPTILDQDGSVGRRLKIVNMLAIPAKDRDPKIRQNAERGLYNDAILAWAVDGLKRMRERNCFLVPESIENNSLSQIESFDIERQFITENCIHIPNFWIPTANGRGLGLCEQNKELNKAYVQWCDNMGYKYPKSMGKLRQEWLRLLGASRSIKKRNRIHYLDVKVIPTPLTEYDEKYYNNEVDFIKLNLKLSEGCTASVDYVKVIYTEFCTVRKCDFLWENVTELLEIFARINRVLVAKSEHFEHLEIIE